MSKTIVVSNRGPLTFRADPDGTLVPVPAAGGLASSLHRLLAGSGTTWASVAMGAADRRGGRPGAHDRGRARPRAGRGRRRHLPAGLRRRRQHDALVRPPPPVRPAAPAPLRPPLAGSLGGLPGLQPGRGRRRRGAGDRGRHRARPGLPLLVARADAGRPAARPALGALLAHPLRRARHARRAARRRGGRAARRHGRLLGLRVPLPRVGGRFPGLLRRGRPAGAGDVHRPARARRRCARRRGGVARVRGGGHRAARRGGRAPHHRPGRPRGAVQEHRARHAGLRGAPRGAPRVARRGGARGLRVSQPPGAGGVSRLRGGRGAHGRAHQPRLRLRRGWWVWRVDADPPVGRGRPGPLARRAHAVRRAA